MLPYDDALKKAQVAADQVKVELSEKELRFVKSTKKEEKKQKKNQLVTIPHKVDLTFASKLREEDLDTTDPVQILMAKFRNGEIDITDLSVDDRFVMIRYMKDDEGLSPDAIAEELSVSRQTVMNYCKRIKALKAQTLADEDIWHIGGEIYSQGIRAMEGAIKTGKVKDWAYVLTSMIATLQSLGLVFKMPKQTQVQSEIMHTMMEKKGQEGFKQIKMMTDNDEINLDAVFSELMDAAKKGVLDKKEVDKK